MLWHRCWKWDNTIQYTIKSESTKFKRGAMNQIEAQDSDSIGNTAYANVKEVAYLCSVRRSTAFPRIITSQLEWLNLSLNQESISKCFREDGSNASLCSTPLKWLKTNVQEGHCSMKQDHLTRMNGARLHCIGDESHLTIHGATLSPCDVGPCVIFVFHFFNYLVTVVHHLLCHQWAKIRTSTITDVFRSLIVKLSVLERVWIKTKESYPFRSASTGVFILSLFWGRVTQMKGGVWIGYCTIGNWLWASLPWSQSRNR